MARSLVRAKHYSYRWPHAAADAFHQLDTLTRALSGPLDVRRLSYPRLWHRDMPSSLGPYRWRAVRGHDANGLPTLSVEAWGSRFVRWQIRYVIAALAEVLAGRLSPQELLHLGSNRAGPVRTRLRGPAPACGLTLQGLAVPAHEASWCQALGLSHVLVQPDGEWVELLTAAAAKDEPGDADLAQVGRE